MNVQQLFNGTLEELNVRISKGSEYDILLLSGLLRKLLVDGDASLIYQLKKKGESIKFRVNIREPLHRRMPNLFTSSDLITYSWLCESGLNPDIADQRREYNPQEVSLDNFLKIVVIFTKGQEITIKQLITHLANKEGGIHKQRRKFSIEEWKNLLLKELSELIGISNLPAGLNTLKTIAIIVSRDLEKYKN